MASLSRSYSSLEDHCLQQTIWTETVAENGAMGRPQSLSAWQSSGDWPLRGQHSGWRLLGIPGLHQTVSGGRGLVRGPECRTGSVGLTAR